MMLSDAVVQLDIGDPVADLSYVMNTFRTISTLRAGRLKTGA
jgi:hypothetical protein